MFFFVSFLLLVFLHVMLLYCHSPFGVSMTLTFAYILQFGEVDIDGSLVAEKRTGTEDIIMLNNGCLCCTVRGDLVRIISELVEKKKGKFDHIVIETTGNVDM